MIRKSHINALSLVIRTIAIAVMIWFTGNNQIHARMFQVELSSLSGPSIVGVVDTVDDVLVVQQWSEMAGGISYWTPADLPRLYVAVNGNGDRYDIPDAWNGSIGVDWGFVNSASVADSLWQEGPRGGSGLHDGWGAIITRGVHRVDNDESQWLGIPVSDSAISDVHFNVVTVTPIPEPSSSMLFLSAIALLASAARRSSRIMSCRFTGTA